jgi:IS5 family transposase
VQRDNASPTFTDAAVADLGGRRTTRFLQTCAELVPWDELGRTLAALFPEHERGGRPFWAAGVMAKCVMLQKWFGLSDPQLEEQLRDRISFRRFVGLSFDDATPDETTLVNFRKRLREHGMASTLFEAVVAGLRARGLVVKEGTLVDATIVDAPVGEKVTDPHGPGLERHTHDGCATYTRNHGTLRHGYKAHVATDARGMIVDWLFDTAAPHDSNHIDQLTAGEPTAVYADSAYGDRERRTRLAGKGVLDRIVYKRVRGQKELAPWQKAHNTACSRVRAFVEHPRAWMVKMGYTFARYRGPARNALDFALVAIAYNLKRSFSLPGRPLTPAAKSH